MRSVRIQSERMAHQRPATLKDQVRVRVRVTVRVGVRVMVRVGVRVKSERALAQ